MRCGALRELCRNTSANINEVKQCWKQPVGTAKQKLALLNYNPLTTKKDKSSQIIVTTHFLTEIQHKIYIIKYWHTSYK